MPEVSLKLDWLTVTFPYQKSWDVPETEDDVVSLMRRIARLTDGKDSYFPLPGRQGYSYVAVTDIGVTLMAGNNSRQGMAIVFSAQAIQRFGGTEAVCTWYTTLAIQMSFRVTRYDVALDVRGALTPDVESVAIGYEMYIDAKGKQRPKRLDIRGNKNDLETVYFGSRQSDRFVRIYDKAHEQGLDNEKWVRFELEHKGELARRFDGDWYAVAATFYADMTVEGKKPQGKWSWLLEAIDLSCTAKAKPYSKPPKSQEDAATMRWWRESVIASLRKTVVSDPERASEMIGEIMTAYRNALEQVK